VRRNGRTIWIEHVARRLEIGALEMGRTENARVCRSRQWAKSQENTPFNLHGCSCSVSYLCLSVRLGEVEGDYNVISTNLLLCLQPRRFATIWQHPLRRPNPIKHKRINKITNQSRTPKEHPQGRHEILMRLSPEQPHPKVTNVKPNERTQSSRSPPQKSAKYSKSRDIFNSPNPPTYTSSMLSHDQLRQTSHRSIRLRNSCTPKSQFRHVSPISLPFFPPNQIIDPKPGTHIMEPTTPNRHYQHYLPQIPRHQGGMSPFPLAILNDSDE
jgi:hypothetical protein